MLAARYRGIGAALLALLLFSLLSMHGCSAEVDGPAPTVTAVVTAYGSNVICTCDAIDQCEKPAADVLSIQGTGFAPLPVKLLGDTPALELPTVVLQPATGSAFTIYGDDPTRNPAEVKLEYLSASELKLTLPASYVKDLPPGKYAVTVKNPNGSQSELPDGLEVVLGPRVTKVTPAVICPTIDQPVKVSGENFRPGAKVALISGGTSYPVEATYNEQTKDLEIVVKKGTIQPGKYSVQVVLAEGCSHTLKDALEMVPEPKLTQIEPAVVCTQADATITLTGQDFRQGATVSIGGTPLPAADVQFVDATTLKALVRAGQPIGAHDVTVTNPEGCSATLPGALTVVPPPTLSSVAPPSICSGGTVTLTGTGFLPGASVTIGTTVVTAPAVTVVSPTSITVTTANVAPGGPFDVTVTNADGCSSGVLTGALTITPAVVSIVAVDPSVVYNKVDFPITIFGAGFKAGVVVTLGTTPPTTLTNVVVTSAERIDAIVPKGVAPGTYDLTVLDSGGCSYTLAAAIKVIDQLTVAICGIDPPFGYTAEKTAVTITSGTGTGCSAGTQQFVSTPRAWLDVNGTLRALRSVAFVTSTSLTGIVEAGLTVGGPYDLLVQNPDGQIGLLAGAFRVVDQPVPQIEALNPSTVDTQYTGNLVITGKNFRSPVKVEAISATGTKTALTSPVVAGGTQITAGLNVGTLALAVGAYVIRVTNTDQGTYSDFSALAITNPSGNLSPWSTATSMVTARRRHALVAGRVSSAARFLYALGGDGGGASPAALDTVDLGPLDKFGNTGTWLVQRYKLNTARTGLTSAVQGRYLYVFGGDSGGASPTYLKSVERAVILDPAEAPEVTSFSFTLGGTLAKGAWYYRVSATMPATHATNPGGETLPSDPVVIQAISNVKVSLSWKAVPGAASYNVYRTPAAGGAVGGEQLLADNITATSYEDAGGTIKNATQTPLPLGATGVFVQSGIPELSAARSGAALALAHDPAGNLLIYVAGGRSAAGAGGVLDSVDFATLSSDGATLGNFNLATQKMGNPRELLMLVGAEHDTSPKVAAGTTYLFVAGGTSGTAATSDGRSASVASGGQPSAFTAVSALKNIPVGAAGHLVNDTFYYFGGAADGTTASSTSNSCEFTSPPAFKNCNSLGPAQLIGGARMNAGLALESAYFYLAGGGPTSTSASKDVIKTIY